MNILKISVILSLLGFVAYASATRFVDVDVARSSDRTKTWTMPATSGTLALSGSGSGCTFEGLARWIGTTSCSWQRTSNGSFGNYTADTDCTTPTGGNLVGNVTAPGTKIPGLVFTTNSSFAYQIVATGEFITTGSAQECSYRFSDGTVNTDANNSGSLQDEGIGSIVGTYLPSSSASQTVQIQSTGANGNTNCVISNGRASPYGDMTITVYKCPKDF